MPTSRSGFHDARLAGFTLKELLAVVVVVVLLVAIVYPAIITALHDQKANPLMQQGAQLAKELLSKQLAGLPVEEVYPMTPQNGGTKEYASSTQFFHHLIQDGIIHHNYSIFGGMGARPVKTTEAGRFAPDNNAWNVVVDAPTAKNVQIPLLISRNLLLPDNRLPGGTLNEKGENLQALIENTSDRLLQFSGSHLVIITRSASGNAVYAAKDLGPGTAHRLNPTAHRLPVLRP